MERYIDKARQVINKIENSSTSRRIAAIGLAATSYIGLCAGMDADNVFRKNIEIAEPIPVLTVQEPIQIATAPQTQEQQVVHHEAAPPAPAVVEKTDYNLVAKLKAARFPDGRRNDALENRIAIEILKDVHLTKRGYEEFKRNINRDHVGEFERRGLIPRNGNGTPILSIRPLYFVFHHTAHIYDYKKRGFFNSTSNFVDGIVRDGNSVQWSIDRDSKTYQYASNPFTAANHARSLLNRISAGVEIETWPGQQEADSRIANGHLNGFQGDLITTQYEEAGYLATYVTTELWKIPYREALSRMVGHDQIDEILGQDHGKPDNQTPVMAKYLPKIEDLLKELSGDPRPIPYKPPRP